MSKRREDAFATRQLANQTAMSRPHPKHISNDDELKFRHCEEPYQPSHLMNFTKGLPHDHETGLICDPQHYQYFVNAIDSGDVRDFRDTPLGFKENYQGHVCKTEDLKWKSKKAKTSGKESDKGRVPIRAWESQSAGNSFDLEGPDAQAVTMPPAPKLGSEELTAEMAEVYAQAILRDTPFSAFSPGVTGIGSKKSIASISKASALEAFHLNEDPVASVKEMTDALNKLKWFDPAEAMCLTPAEKARRRDYTQVPGNAFRGITMGDNIGPYISQFLLAGNSGINSGDGERSPSDGLVTYGANSIDQRVRTATEEDYLTDWDEWFDAQLGADFRGLEKYESSPARRFIHTPRDLSTYVHYDALYQAYLNACLIMLANGVPFDPGIPFQEGDDRDHQQGFAHFGGPHILSLVTEVATRALKAVRFQKYNVHRRCRPEVLAARVHKADTNIFKEMAPELSKMKKELEDIGILGKIKDMNPSDSYLLPMAFCEGSPMHPAYGAGHATVAGACVTILKAFFDHKHPLNIVPIGDIPKEVKHLIKDIAPHVDPKSCHLAYVSGDCGAKLDIVPVLDQDRELAKLTVEGELNKLASNIAIGRNWAGVHYFTDYYESLLMGEQIAIGILEEQKLTYSENFSMTLATFDGNTIRI